MWFAIGKFLLHNNVSFHSLQACEIGYEKELAKSDFWVNSYFLHEKTGSKSERETCKSAWIITSFYLHDTTRPSNNSR